MKNSSELFKYTGIVKGHIISEELAEYCKTRLDRCNELEEILCDIRISLNNLLDGDVYGYASDELSNIVEKIEKVRES